MDEPAHGNPAVPAAALLAAVQRSPERVAAHDRAGWCGLYTADGEVNDPVGSRLHRGPDAIGRFYDTFIAPNEIVFHVEHDLVCGMTVWRDLEVETRLSTGLQTRVPMHLRYDLVEQGGALKIRRLCAHWELPRMVLRLLASGLPGWWTALKLGPQLIAHQGLGGMAGFMQGYAGVGRSGKRAVAGFLYAAARGDRQTAFAQMAAGARLESCTGAAMAPNDCIALLRDAEVGKMLAAGRSVSASLKLGGRHGIALFGFEPGGRLPASVQLFV
jgi:hypothetical protein